MLSRGLFAALVLSQLAAAQLTSQDETPVPGYPRTLALSIVTQKGEPVPGALVEVWVDAEHAGLSRYSNRFAGSSRWVDAPVIQPPMATQTADADGTLTIQLAQPSTVFAASSPEAGSSAVWTASSIEGTQLKVTLRPSWVLAGEVRLADGTPAPHSVVVFNNYGLDTYGGAAAARAPADATTGEDGRFQVTAEWGFHGRAWAKNGDVRTEEVFVSAPMPDPEHVVLQVPGAFHIRGLCKGPDGEAVGGITVYANRRSTDLRQANTSDIGSFDIPLVHPGQYQLEASQTATRRGLVLPTWPIIEVSADVPAADVTLSLVKALTVRGTVSGTFRGTVFVFPQFAETSPFLWHPGQDSVLLSGPGDFEVNGLLPGQSCDICAALSNGNRFEGWPARPTVRVRDVKAGSTGIALVFDDDALRGGGAVVHCVDALSGQPLVGAIVRDAYHSTLGPLAGVAPSKNATPAVAEAGGTARVVGLTLGDPHWLYVSADGHEPQAVGPFDASRDPLALTARLAPLATRELQVRNADGTPAAGATVVIFIPPGETIEVGLQVTKTAADAEGRGSVSAGHGRIRWLQALDGERISPPQLVKFELGAPPVALTLSDPAAPPARGALDVLVVDRAKRPLRGLPVQLTPNLYAKELLDRFKASGTTDDTGRVHFDDLLPIVWFLSSSDDDQGHGYGDVVVEAGATESFVLVAE